MTREPETTVVNMHVSKADIAVDRTGPFGNPFFIGRDGDRATVLAKYREYLIKRITKDPEFRRQVLTLRGKRLGCWCQSACHGMIIVEWLLANPEAV